jgi:hypothetical protein
MANTEYAKSPIGANEYSFKVTGALVDADVTGLYVRKSDNSDTNKKPDVRITINSTASESVIIEALKMTIRSIESDHLPNASEIIAKGEAGALIMWETLNKILEAARAIVDGRDVGLLEAQDDDQTNDLP